MSTFFSSGGVGENSGGTGDVFFSIGGSGHTYQYFCVFGCVSMSVIFLIVVVAVVGVMRLLVWKVVVVVWWLCCGLCFRESSAAEIFWGFC